METTEKIVEAYVRYIKNWATIPNIRCDRQHEIDLLAIDPVTSERYHIETGVSVPGPFSKLTVRAFDPKLLKVRVQMPAQRRTFGYFLERKFGTPAVLATLKTYGFEDRNYTRIIVSWGWQTGVQEEAAKHSVVLWDFADLMRTLGKEMRARNSHFADDTLRTLQLYSRVIELHS